MGFRGAVSRSSLHYPCYFPGMKQNDNISNSITEPLLRDLIAQDRASRVTPVISSVDASLPEPAELDQDAGGGYNDDRTFPQE